MRSICKIATVFVLVLSFGFLLEAIAAPVVITSGSVRPNGGTFSPNGLVITMSFSFSGDMISGSGGNGGQPPLGSISGCQVNCVVGDLVSPNALVTTGSPAFSGRVTYQGNLYEVVQANFSFSGEPSVLGDVFATNGVQRVSLPFEMTGNLNLRSLDPTIPNVILEITGSGAVNISYAEERVIAGLTDPDTSALVSIEYVFDGPTPQPTISPEPVPEPTTILLLGFGLFGLKQLTKRKRNSKNSS